MTRQDDTIVNGLWSEGVSKEEYGKAGKYQDHLLEQYKLCIEMADRVSSRRSVANTLFLTVHTLIVSAIGFLYEKGLAYKLTWVVTFVLVALLALCYSWWRIVKSYRQLNTAKFKVIGEFEKHLPASPYWSAEWKALGEGKDPKLYIPLTKIENWIPIIFALLYIAAAVIIIRT